MGKQQEHRYYVGDFVDVPEYGTGMVVLVEEDLPQVRGGVLLSVRLADESVRHFTLRKIKPHEGGIPEPWPWATK